MRPGSQGIPVVDVAIRAVFCGFGVAAIAWGLYAGSTFWRTSSLDQTARYIIAGETVKPAVLSVIEGGLQDAHLALWDRPSTLTNSAIVRLRILERAISSGDQTAVDAQAGLLQETVRRSLSESPTDSFLWVVLFWLENTRNGFNRENVKYLAMSYSTGPGEGWIGVRRNRLALSVFAQLPSDIASAAVDEFSRLVDSQFIPEMADILVGPGWPIRNSLLAGLKSVELANRERFARIVYRLGYNITVPGVEPRGQRPWD